MPTGLYESRAGHLDFAVLQCSSKCYFQAILAKKNYPVSGPGLFKLPSSSQVDLVENFSLIIPLLPRVQKIKIHKL